MTISRRKLLRNSGASAIGVAGMSHTAVMAHGGATPVPTQWDDEVDVVVVGSGAAGISAAIAANDADADVLVLEKAAYAGGTSLLAFGIVVPNNAQMREHGIEDPREEAIQFMARISYPSLYDSELEFYGMHETDYALLEAFYDHASPTFEFLDEIGALKTGWGGSFGFGDKPEISDPDYHANLPENKAPYGRGLVGSSDDPTKMMFQQQLLAYANDQEIPIR